MCMYSKVHNLLDGCRFRRYPTGNHPIREFVLCVGLAGHNGNLFAGVSPYGAKVCGCSRRRQDLYLIFHFYFELVSCIDRYTVIRWIIDCLASFMRATIHSTRPGSSRIGRPGSQGFKWRPENKKPVPRLVARQWEVIPLLPIPSLCMCHKP